jgi:aspartate oxidase
MMTRRCGILRNETDMLDAQAWVQSHLSQLEGVDLKGKKEMETLNLLEVSAEVLKASIERKKSVGAHFRTDE